MQRMRLVYFGERVYSGCMMAATPHAEQKRMRSPSRQKSQVCRSERDGKGQGSAHHLQGMRTVAVEGEVATTAACRSNSSRRR
jgi:hypothetical protein